MTTSLVRRRRRKAGGFSVAPLVVAMVMVMMSLQPEVSEGFPSVSPPVASKSCWGSTRTTTSTPLISTRTLTSTLTLTSSSATTTTTALNALAATTTDLLFNSDVWVFVAGIFPFMWATYEFWRRIMFGESFGTGTDRVIIGMEDSPKDSRGTRVLGRGALITAYVLFICAFGTLAVVGYSVATSEPPSVEALAAAVAASAASTGGGPPAL